MQLKDKKLYKTGPRGYEMEIIEKALNEGRNTLSEYESKQILSVYHIPVVNEILTENIEDLLIAVRKIGYPLVLKGCSPEIAHKTEKGLIRMDIRDDEEAKAAFDEIFSRMDGSGNAVLVQEMIKGKRELVAGMTRDAQFGPCVMFGLGGIFTEILKDISFRVAPLEKRDAMDMMREIKGSRILEAVRGMEAADMDMMAQLLINTGRIGLENERIREIDINPVIISGSKPVAVDALIILE